MGPNSFHLMTPNSLQLMGPNSLQLMVAKSLQLMGPNSLQLVVAKSLQLMVTNSLRLVVANRHGMQGWQGCELGYELLVYQIQMVARMRVM